MLDNPDLNAVRDIVIDIARRELPHRFANAARARKADGTVVTEADFAVQHGIQTSLKEKWPTFAFLGEEMDPATQQQSLDAIDTGVWCLDPLDGTNNFTAGIPYYAVSLAFLKNGQVQLAVVYDPARDECFTAERGRGARLNGDRLTSDDTGLNLSQAMGLVDLKRLSPALVERLAHKAPYSSQRSFGAVALDWCWLAAGRVHVYLHGSQKLWDYAGGSLVLSEAGGQAVTLQGDSVFQPTLKPRSSVAALDPALFNHWTRWLEINVT